MNVLKIYSVKDTAVEAFATPFFCTNDVVAIRMLTGLVNQENSAYSVSPSDFTLYCLGHFDILTGEIVQEEPRRIRNGLALVYQRPTNGNVDLLDELVGENENA